MNTKSVITSVLEYICCFRYTLVYSSLKLYSLVSRTRMGLLHLVPKTRNTNCGTIFLCKCIFRCMKLLHVILLHKKRGSQFEPALVSFCLAVMFNISNIAEDVHTLLLSKQTIIRTGSIIQYNKNREKYNNSNCRRLHY